MSLLILNGVRKNRIKCSSQKWGEAGVINEMKWAQIIEAGAWVFECVRDVYLGKIKELSIMWILEWSVLSDPKAKTYKAPIVYECIRMFVTPPKSPPTTIIVLLLLLIHYKRRYIFRPWTQEERVHGAPSIYWDRWMLHKVQSEIFAMADGTGDAVRTGVKIAPATPWHPARERE